MESKVHYCVDRRVSFTLIQTIGKIIVLYILITEFLREGKEDQRRMVTSVPQI
jgi:RNA-binding protein YhbY